MAGAEAPVRWQERHRAGGDRDYVRDGEGRFANTPGGVSAAADKLKLDGRIRLGHGETLAGSAAVPRSGFAAAAVDSPTGRQVRLGVGIDPDHIRRWSAANKGSTVVLDEHGVAELRSAIGQMHAGFELGRKRNAEFAKRDKDLHAREEKLVGRQYPGLSKAEAKELAQANRKLAEIDHEIGWLQDRQREELAGVPDPKDQKRIAELDRLIPEAVAAGRNAEPLRRERYRLLSTDGQYGKFTADSYVSHYSQILGHRYERAELDARVAELTADPVPLPLDDAAELAQVRADIDSNDNQWGALAEGDAVAEGSVAGGWGSVWWQVSMDGDKPQALLAVVPPGWPAGRPSNYLDFDAAELRKLTGLLDELAPAEAPRQTEGISMSWWNDTAELVREAAPEDADEILAAVAEAVADVDLDDEAVDDIAETVLEAWFEDDERDEASVAWDSAEHPRAAAGAAGGGRFAAGGGGGTKQGMGNKPKGKAGRAKKRSGDDGTLSFDGKSGTGYGKKGGDPRVRKLQTALNRLGLTDSRGNKLLLDGKLGPKTTQAVKAAQRRLGLPANGKVTPQLLVKLVAAKSLRTPAAKKAAAKTAAKPAAAAKKPAGKATSTTSSSGSTRTTVTRRAEAIDGQRSTGDTREILGRAVTAWAKERSENSYAWAHVCDFTDDLVVFEWDGKTWQAPYSLTESGTTGTAELDEPAEVVAQTWYVPAAGGDPTMPATDGELDDELAAAESVEPAEGEVLDRIDGRVIEAKGTDDAGGRIFRVRIIAAGDSKNGRRYPAKVLQEAVGLYDGAKAYDHHRTMEELRSGTISGLVGYYRNVEAASDGLDGDLCLLPSAAHTAEALDATIAAQDQGLPPLVGISHDAMTVLKPITVGGRRMQEATAITKVNSADVVSDPAAGGKATRVLAGGIEPDESKESDVAVSATDVLAALKTATPEDLAAVGLQRSSETTEVEPEGMEKTSFLGGLMIKEKVTAAGLPVAVAESLTSSLPDRITESLVDDQVAALKSVLGVAERAGLAPSVTAVVTQEAFDKKKAALDAFFAGDFSTGYRSFRQAYLDVTGHRPASWDEDLNKRIMRESVGTLYDSGDRSTESLTSTSWNLVLGDSITRRLIAAYAHPSLQTWRQIVSSTIPVSDFRQQRIDRIGGYGTLPTVNQGAPYQPLTSPSNEEITYALAKKGGTEDLTFEMIANDDVRAIAGIPGRLGLAAARTLHNFVWDFILQNLTCTYDSTALFHANHANTTAVALGQSTLSQARAKMRDQTAYGDTSDILSLVPQTLIVPNELEELGFQLTRSAVAVPSTPAGPSNTPNLHQNMSLIVVDYDTDANDWFLVADPSLCPTIEVGFYNGRQDPEIFTQSDATVGSMFNADVLTYKIRHIYSGALLEHRGFQRGTQ